MDLTHSRHAMPRSHRHQPARVPEDAAERPGACASACPASACAADEPRSTAATACRTACATARGLRLDRARRHREHRRAPLRDGPGRAHRPAAIVADELEADWKRVRVVQAPGDESEVRQPGHRRLAQHAALFEPMRRCGAGGAHDAGAGRGRALERAARRGARRRTTRSCTSRAGASSATARSRRGGQARRAGARDAEAEGPVAVPLHRQGRPDRSPTVRTSSPARRSTASTRACPACSTRSSRGRRCSAARSRLRRGRGDEGAGRRQGVRARGHAAAFGVPAAWAASSSSARTPGRRSRAARRSRSTGTTGRTRATTRTPTARSWRRRSRKPGGKVVRNEGDADAALAERGEEARGRLLRAALRARDDGAPPRPRASSTASARSGRRASRRRPRATGSPSA